MSGELMNTTWSLVNAGVEQLNGILLQVVLLPNESVPFHMARNGPFALRIQRNVFN